MNVKARKPIGKCSAAERQLTLSQDGVGFRSVPIVPKYLSTSLGPNLTFFSVTNLNDPSDWRYTSYDRATRVRAMTPFDSYLLAGALLNRFLP